MRNKFTIFKNLILILLILNSCKNSENTSQTGQGPSTNSSALSSDTSDKVFWQAIELPDNSLKIYTFKFLKNNNVIRTSTFYPDKSKMDIGYYQLKQGTYTKEKNLKENNQYIYTFTYTYETCQPIKDETLRIYENNSAEKRTFSFPSPASPTFYDEAFSPISNSYAIQTAGLLEDKDCNAAISPAQITKIKQRYPCMSGPRLTNDVNFSTGIYNNSKTTIKGPFYQGSIGGQVSEIFVGRSQWNDLMIISKVTGAAAQMLGWNIAISMCTYGNGLVSDQRQLSGFQAPTGITIAENPTCAWGDVLAAYDTIMVANAIQMSDGYSLPAQTIWTTYTIASCSSTGSYSGGGGYYP